MKIKAIMFDIDNTLIPTKEFSKIARNAAVDSLILGGLNLEKKIIFNKLNKIIKRFGSNYPHHFDVLLDELNVEKKIRSKLVAKAVIAYHNAKQILHPYPEVPATLMKLSMQGYKLYAVSEGLSKKQWEKLIRAGLDGIINHAFMTEDYMFPVKQPEFYEVILHELKLKPNECVMVGDKIEKDILPAKAVGIHTVLINREKKIKKLDSYVIQKLSDLHRILPLIEERMKNKK